MEERVQATEARTVAATSGVAAIAAKAAAAAKAVQAERHLRNGTAHSVQSLTPTKVGLTQASGGELSQDIDEKAPPRSLYPRPPPSLVADVAQSSHVSSSRPPELFSMDADDDTDDNSSPANVLTLSLEEQTSNFSSPEKAPGLSAEEELEYQEIEARFERFRERQTEVEQNVSALLARLNTQIRVPSSCASSECGDLTSLASSEWDTESLGPTEDGLSMLSSRNGSPIGSPRDATFATDSSLSLSAPTLELLKQATPTPRTSLGGVSSKPHSARSPEMLKRTSFGGSTSARAVERGDLSDLRSNGPEMAKAGSDSPSRQSMQTAMKQPRLTSQLLAQSGLQQQQELKAENAQVWAESHVPNFGSPKSALEKHGEARASQGDKLPVLGGLSAPPPLSPRAAVTQKSVTAMAPGAPPPVSVTAPANACFVSVGSSEVRSPMQSSTQTYCTPTQSPAIGSRALPGFGGESSFPDDEDLARWCGWTVVATPEGRLFFHNEHAQLSQWSQPPELANVLGEWVEIFDDSQPDAPRFWRNDFLCISLWKDPRQTTNIFQAALDGNLFFLQLYAEVDGQLDVIDPKGRGALHYSCAGGATQSALFLLQRKAQVDRRDETASTPLMFACRYGYASIVKLLLDAQAGLNVANDLGNTALHEAASMGHLDCLHLLLLCGASATARNAEGDGAADIATAKKHFSCLTLLRKHLNYSARGDKQDNRRTVPASMVGPSVRPSDSSFMHSTVLEVPSTTSESDPFLGIGSSSDPSLAKSHGTTTSSNAGGSKVYDNATIHERAGAECGGGSHPSSGHIDVQHRRGRRAAGRPPQVEYAGESSDSDLNEVAEVLTAKGLVGYDSDGASSGDSSDAQEDPNERRSRGATSRSRNGRRERSPVALGLLSRMQFVPHWLGAARRWMSGPVQADLGLPNRYHFNESTSRWECPDDAEVDK